MPIPTEQCIFILSGQRNIGAERCWERHEQSWEAAKDIAATANSLTGQEASGLGCTGDLGADSQRHRCQQEHKLHCISLVQYCEGH